MGGLSQGCPFLPHTFRPLYTLPPMAWTFFGFTLCQPSRRSQFSVTLREASSARISPLLHAPGTLAPNFALELSLLLSSNPTRLSPFGYPMAYLPPQVSPLFPQVLGLSP